MEYLVTLDWHQDLIFPNDTEKEWLNKLDLRSNYEVALFSWMKLRSLNDSHILAAAYLNLIGNIYVQCRQEFHNSWEDEFLTDRYGNAHRIIKFKDYNHIEQYLLNSDETQVYFDIDLDFFTLNNPLNGVGNKFTYIKEEAIKNMLNYNRPLINWIFKRLKGITIAKEPKHTGGMLKSNRLLSIINNCWFDNSLFLSYPCDYNRDTEWKHLKKK